jgi:hypothetical protein
MEGVSSHRDGVGTLDKCKRVHIMSNASWPRTAYFPSTSLAMVASCMFDVPS